MTNPQKDKGDKGELEAARLLSDLLGTKVVRKLGAGRKEDTGDLYGVPNTCVQVLSTGGTNISTLIKRKLTETEQQRQRMGAKHCVLLVRLRGGVWRALVNCLEHDQSMYFTVTAPGRMPVHDALRWLPEMADAIWMPQLEGDGVSYYALTLQNWAEQWREMTRPGDQIVVA